MKILMLCDFFQEGLDYQENHLVEYYCKFGHDVLVICSLYDNVFDFYNGESVSGPLREYEWKGARIIKMPYRYNILHKLRAYPSIRRQIADFHPDLIYVHDIMLNLPECISYVKHNPDTKMIMDFHADYCNSGRNWFSTKVLHGIIRKWFLDRARPHLEKIFPIVPAGITFLHEVYGVPHEEMELLPLGTDLDFGREIRASGGGRTIRNKLGIGPDDFVIFTGGKLTPFKKTETLVEAFLRLDRTNAHLLVVGAAAPADASRRDPPAGDRFGSVPGYYEGLIAAAAGHPHIHFRGWRSKKSVYKHLDAADIAVFPASQSVLWQQSIGMGLPLIVGDRSELMAPSDASYLNRHNNVIVLDHTEPTASQIERLLRELIDDKPRLARMSDGACRTAGEMLDWNDLIKETLRFNTNQSTKRDARCGRQ